MSDFEHNTKYAKYDCFKVGPESGKYVLTATGYSGDAGDSLGYHHNGSPFSTKDVDNDAADTGYSCAQHYKGGWWYGTCHHANLNGQYLGGAHTSHADGVNWYHWKGYDYSLKFVEMKFREEIAESNNIVLS